MLKLAGELIEGQLADHMADLDAHHKELWDTFRTGQYYRGAGAFQAYTSGGAIVANTLYAFPLWIPRAMTLDRIAVQVTAQAGQKVRLGIYNDGTNLYPGILVKDAGEITLSSTGVKTIDIDPTALTKGLYWVACVSDGTPSLRMEITYEYILGVGAANFSTFYRGWTVSHTYAALPDPFTAGGSLNASNTARPAILVRIKSLD